MIEEMCAFYWRQRRSWSIETGMLNKQMATQPDGGMMERMVGAFDTLAASHSLSLAYRYETRLHLMHQRALRTLIMLRKSICQTTPVPFPNTRRLLWSNRLRPSNPLIQNHLVAHALACIGLHPPLLAPRKPPPKLLAASLPDRLPLPSKRRYAAKQVGQASWPVGMGVPPAKLHEKPREARGISGWSGWFFAPVPSALIGVHLQSATTCKCSLSAARITSSSPPYSSSIGSRAHAGRRSASFCLTTSSCARPRVFYVLLGLTRFRQPALRRLLPGIGQGRKTLSSAIRPSPVIEDAAQIIGRQAPTVRRRAESPTSGHPNYCSYPIYPNRVIMLRRETGWQPPCHHGNGP
jgi:hypothetical protein